MGRNHQIILKEVEEKVQGWMSKEVEECESIQ